MKKLLLLMTIAGMLSFGATNMLMAQNEEETTETATDTNKAVEDTVSAEAEDVEETTEETVIAEPAPQEDQTFHQIIKQKFIEGGAGFMSIVLICLIMGLAICIERIIYLNLATTNTDKLLKKVEDA